ncbi:MAG: ShlB/FhaC/HecB family hemolysin secretion/activation protein, partial [Betaproteobacteria bacterium HGW-Betaproteobacteria-13]
MTRLAAVTALKKWVTPQLLHGFNRSLPVLVALALTLTLIPQARAQAPAQADRDAAARQAEILQRQDELRRRQELERQIPPDRSGGGIDTRGLMPPVDASGAGLTCREINKISISGAPNLSTSTRERIESEFSGRCLGVSEIEQILALITQDYIFRGFVTTRAYLPQQDLSTGQLEILVIEGVIEKILLEDGAEGSVRASNAFPVSAGELLNLRDIAVRNEPSTPFHASLSYDNQGSKSTGDEQYGVSLSADRLFGLNEFLLFSHRQSAPHDEDRKLSESNSLTFVLPLGYSTFTFTKSESRYVSLVNAPSGLDLQTSGTSESDIWRLDRTVYRDQSSRVGLAGTLTMKSSKNYLEGLLLGVSSRRLSIFDLDGTLTTGFLGGSLTLELGYARGLDFAGALKDGPNLPREAPRAQFEKYKYGYYFSRPFQVGGLDLAFTSQLTGQIAKDTLYGSEQLLIGGIYTVRGFVNNTLSGDHGYYVRNELSLRRTFSMNGTAMPMRFYMALDQGEVSNRVAGIPQGLLQGGAVGVTMSIKGGSLDVFTAYPIDMPDFLKAEE